jgi:hypothetical protein
MPSHLTRHKNLEEMICDFLEVSDIFYMSPHNRLLFLVNSYTSENLHVLKLLKFVIFHCLRDRCRILLIENDLEAPSPIIDFNHHSHLLVYLTDSTAYCNDLSHTLTTF